MSPLSIKGGPPLVCIYVSCGTKYKRITDNFASMLWIIDLLQQQQQQQYSAAAAKPTMCTPIVCMLWAKFVYSQSVPRVLSYSQCCGRCTSDVECCRT